MSKAIYPGTFDPITKGHLDIIARSAALYDEVIVVIMRNEQKTALFSEQERKAMIEKEIELFPNVSVDIGEGLTVNYAMSIGAHVMIRGIRAVLDYEYELQNATANMLLAPHVETVFLLAKPMHSFLSSSVAKTVAMHQGDMHEFVSEQVAQALQAKYHSEK
ncbi:MAG: pantetheine-phosphate adenylyltransferase [Erysipelotrichaceae bacterium]